MTLVANVDTLPDSIQLDLDLARAELVDARFAQRRKDTPAARARVEACLRSLDVLLDLWNDTSSASS